MSSVTLRERWVYQKTLSEKRFKSLYANELTKIPTGKLTMYPVKFDKGLGPVLDKYEAAMKANKRSDAALQKSKAKAIIAIYRTRIDNHGNKTVLDEAWSYLDQGLNLLLQGLG